MDSSQTTSFPVHSVRHMNAPTALAGSSIASVSRLVEYREEGTQARLGYAGSCVALRAGSVAAMHKGARVHKDATLTKDAIWTYLTDLPSNYSSVIVCFAL